MRRSLSKQGLLLIPLLAVFVFVAAMAAILWLLHLQEVQQQHDALVHDAGWVQQKMRWTMQNTQTRLQAIARGLPSTETPRLSALATKIERENAAIDYVGWIDADGMLRDALPANSEFNRRFRHASADPDLRRIFEQVRQTRRPAYATIFNDSQNVPHLTLVLPVAADHDRSGLLVALYSLPALLDELVPSELAQRYAFAFVNANGLALTTNSVRPTSGTGLRLEPLLATQGGSLLLRIEPYPTPSHIANDMLHWLIIGLSSILLWSLWSLWRHMRSGAEAEQALVAETYFRRAMEDSMLIGMRALDFEGRITYVNAAFCRMTGWSEQDLVGQTYPFKYWSREHFDEMRAQLDMTLTGQVPSSGFEMPVQRKDGSVFYARMYVSPLIDADGKQTGWISSMTDISEPRRAREELAAAHQRFTTVLEELDAAVSVLAADGQQLLFANRYYRQLFGTEPAGHRLLAGGQQPLPSNAPADTTEAFAAEQQKWFEVRRRQIQWVDGAAAQMLIATDITARHNAEETARQHAQQLQFASRLTTMGEMASSLAHELNQPLAAINNYCMGAVARLRSGSTSAADLAPALEKASAQAVRAGSIIARIRSFVKRSAPQRRAAQIAQLVADAVELAEIEARRLQMRIQTDLQPDLPSVFADPLLIEQVLVNLLKNAAEAMHQQDPQRIGGLIRLRAYWPGDEPSMVAIDVSDQGPGIAEADLPHLFDPFFTTKNDGMGIGLNICRSIIESHQGRLWVENHAPPEPGCTFHILLPIESAQAA